MQDLRSVLLALAISVLLAAPAAAGPFEDGVAAYDQGDYTTAFRLLLPLAEQGDAAAQNKVGSMYNYGNGIPRDPAEAAKWSRSAIRLLRPVAERGDAKAQYDVGGMYFEGRGVPADSVEALRWYRMAGQQGYGPAQSIMGFMYESGWGGVPEDDAEAVKWYRLAAEQGDLNSQLSLGHMYRLGDGVKQDYAESIAWFRLAAEQGDTGAQGLVGMMYNYGWGVPQDFAAAVTWYLKAAQQGDIFAQFSLGKMYDSRPSVKDKVLAHKWFNLAASKGFKKAARSRDIVAEDMTPSQIAEAQRQARVWRPK